MGQLMNGLKQIDLHRCLNIIVVADHGNSEHTAQKDVLNFISDEHYSLVPVDPVSVLSQRNILSVVVHFLSLRNTKEKSQLSLKN